LTDLQLAGCSGEIASSSDCIKHSKTVELGNAAKKRSHHPTVPITPGYGLRAGLNLVRDVNEVEG